MTKIRATSLPLLALLLIGPGCNRSAPGIDSAVTRGIVTIEIVGQTETQEIVIDDVAKGTTLEQVMRTITAIPIAVQGSGTTAFVDQIGDQATDNSGGWTFTVDGEFANQGIGNTFLSPPTKVTWRFGDGY